MVSLSSSIPPSVSPIPVMRTSPLLVVQTSCALGADNTEIRNTKKFEYRPQAAPLTELTS